MKYLAAAFAVIFAAMPARAGSLDDAYQACWSRNLKVDSPADWDPDCKLIARALDASRDRQAAAIKLREERLIRDIASKIRRHEIPDWEPVARQP